ncbi:hypothetical protein KP509_19G044200 [Ceratopteris richardii]|uniref:HTH myb-type domain-containing protein n=1 Tax=Ceratopteris richardii TaxID=49495 RepID=A0A8T2SLY2_CERRI|nr:hypothetical protein KP509_1Z288700 [Ceratopteris richardii]KAH7352422.1 hypothetical protein KP509_19G044200 [Ceratopteris richardii]
MELTLGRTSYVPFEDQYVSCSSISREPRNATRSIEAYLRSLIDERQKIEAFKRELPICMHLLSSEIEASRMQLCECAHGEICGKHSAATTSGFSKSVSALPKSDFIISKILNSLPEDIQSPNFDNEDAMSPSGASPCLHAAEANTSEDQEEVSNVASMLYNTKSIRSCTEGQPCSSNSIGKTMGSDFWAFFTDKKDSLYNTFQGTSTSLLDTHQEIPINVNRATSTVTDIEERTSSEQLYDGFPLNSPSQGCQISNAFSKQLSPHRKPRRCWAPELHRKFVDALQQLGGAEVATPKQIREVMQVDGLTNDEVKSHLQKYRLHMRRPNSSSSIMNMPTEMAHSQTRPTSQLVMFGGIRIPESYPRSQPMYVNYMAPMT